MRRGRPGGAGEHAEPARAVEATRVGARRALLAHLGLLRAETAQGTVVPWRDELRGPAGVREALRRLEAVQVDPVAAVERNHHLVLFARVGDYRPADLETLFPQGMVFEYLANARCILPVETLPDFVPIMLQARANTGRADPLLRRVMADVLEYVRAHGAVAPREIGEDGPRLRGVGYDPPDVESKATGRAIDLLWLGGQLVVAARRGNEKAYDLPERVLAPDLAALLAGGEPPEPDRDAPVRPWSAPVVRGRGRAPWSGMLLRRYMNAFGIADAGDFRFGWQHWPAAERRAAAEELVERGMLVRLEIEGVRRRYYAVPGVAALAAAADAWRVEPEVRLIPPLDHLLWRRERVADLFGFEYVWEVYIPEAKRRFGYYAMPILYGDRLVGRVDPRLLRSEGVLELRRVALEEGFEAGEGFVDAFAAELRRFAGFHGARRVRLGEALGGRDHRRAIRAAVSALRAGRTRRVPAP